MVYKIFEEYKIILYGIIKEKINFSKRFNIEIEINNTIVIYQINTENDKLELKIKIIDIIKHQNNKIKFLKLLLTKNNLIKELIN